jgi:hypothetical protein
MSFVFKRILHADEHVRVWRGQLNGFMPKKKIIQFGNTVLILCGTSHYGKTNHVTVNRTLNSQPYCEGIVVPEIVLFLNQGQLTVF